MGDLDESVFAGNPVGPALDLGSLDFDGGAAATAHEVMMVVVGVAPPVESLARGGPQEVHFSGVREGSELVVDGGEADVFALCPQLGEYVLGGPELVGRVQGCSQRPLLAGGAFLDAASAALIGCHFVHRGRTGD